MVSAQFSFYLIDNFENGQFNSSKWWRFGDLRAEVVHNASVEGRDLIAESCGAYSLRLSGDARDWYVGGIGTELGVDATEFSRFQIDIYGNKEYHGKLIIEIFEDDNHNYTIEQDPKNNYAAIFDDKWVAEVNIQGKGFTRVSLPFSAFTLANPGVGDGIWNPDQKNSSGGLLKLQLVVISDKQQGPSDFAIDNILLNY
ncbi:hypothetical protein HZB07_04765 [Candidatus Saganbacteria bacterium]|nr:hypothetical protein [Candidatus Saganbacteria bacterium]